ncbi:golgi-body localization protein domain-containing protein [Cunninghamella echinulata]|nr:golgi-body localization protein domain-containing protein [Cunninghamella echinulata]
MSLCFYHYVIIVLVFILLRLLLKWMIALHFKLSFGHIGFFSITDINYFQNSKDQQETEMFSITIGKIKLRIKNRSSSLSTAWITLYIEHIHLSINDLQKLFKASSSKNKNNKNTISRKSLSSRVSSIGYIPHKPWIYSISLVKSIVKFVTALPAQLLMAGLANYFDVQFNGILITVEGNTMLNIHDINLSSILFAAITQQNNKNSAHTDFSIHSLNIKDIPSSDQNTLSLNSKHQRHSIKRAQHLFKEKYFEIIVQIGSITIGDKGLILPQGGRIAISCHLSAGCLTLKDVDVNIQVDAINIHVDKLLEIKKLKKAITTNETQPEKEQQGMENQTVYKKKQGSYLYDIFKSVSINISQTRILQNYHDYTIGFDINCITSTILKSDKCLALQAVQNGLQGKLQLELKHSNFFVYNTSYPSKEYAQILSLPEIDINVIIGMGSDGLNKRFVQSELTISNPGINIDTNTMTIIKSLVTIKRPSSKNSINSASQTTKKYLPKFDVTIKMEQLHIDFKLPYQHGDSRAKDQYQGTIQWSTIILSASGEYRLENEIQRSILKDYQKQDQQPLSTENVVRNRKQDGKWRKLFRNSWKFRQSEVSENDDNDNTGRHKWIYNTTGRLAIYNIKLSTQKNNTKSMSSPLTIGSFDIHIGTRMITFNDEDKVMVIWNIKNEHNEVDIKIANVCFNPFVPIITAENEYTLLYWLHIIHELKRLKTTPTSNLQPTIQESQSTAKKINNIMNNWIKWFKINITLSQLIFIMEGVDMGIKGKRDVPDGYIDNSPTEDIYARVITKVNKINFGFHGSSHKTEYATLERNDNRYSMDKNNDLDYNDQHHQNTSTIHLTIKSIKISKKIGKFSQIQQQPISDFQQDDLIFWVPRINANLSLEYKDELYLLDVAIVIKQCGLRFTTANHYALMISLYGLKNIKKTISATSLTPTATIAKKISSADIKIKWWDINKIQLQLNRFDIHATLPNDVGLFLRMDSTRIENNKEHRHKLVLNTQNATLFGVSVNDVSKWDQLLEIDSIQFIKETSNNDAEHISKKPTYQISMSKFYFRAPYRYIIADIVDNSVNLLKYFKSLSPRLSGVIPFTYFGPTVKNTPVSIPRIKLNCKKLMVHFEDDSFEARLRLIWRTGLVEQRSRLDVLEAFEVKAKTEGEERVQYAKQRLNEHNSNTWIKHINAAIQQETTMFENFRSQDYRSSITQRDLKWHDDNDNDDNDENDNGDDSGSGNGSLTSLADLFNIDIDDLPRYFPLFDFTMLEMNLDLRQPIFAIDETRKFMYDVGKGVPLDTDFSTLVPFHIDWKGGETWVQLRDYPIPFLYVPSSQNQDGSDGKTWSLTGDYVFGDQVGTLDSTRSVILSVLKDKNEINGLQYNVEIVRSSSPPKFYSIVNIDVHTDRLCSICWCVPYQPAIQDLSRTMDTFTRPSVDPSDKIGMWDKIRLMIHTRTKISFVGGGDLALVLKGTRDPYDMSDRGFGLAKLWKKNVVWLMGHNNPQGEFMQIISEDLLFGVPDLLNGGYREPHLLLPIENRFNQNDQNGNNNLNRLSVNKPFGYDGDDENYDGRMYSMCSLSSTENETSTKRFLKVALKFTGGIRMGLGCHLERLCTGECEICEGGKNGKERCRHLNFLPHYKVKYKSRRAVDAMPNNGKGYDAFAGFRSDFIHFSMSIIKLSDNDHLFSKLDNSERLVNSLHLSPNFVEHFLACFRLFGGNMSYPLRTGSLYPRLDSRRPKKFSVHMRSMKYKVVVNSLRLGYFYKDENLTDGTQCIEGLGDSVGLKAQIKKFSIDLHQQRETPDFNNNNNNENNNEIQQKQPKPNWTINEAELELRNIDLRVVRATFVDNQCNSNDEQSINDEANNTNADSTSVDETDPDLMDGTDRRADEDETDSTWIDMKDFIELNVINPEITPKVKVLPFAFSPCMYYIKQNDPKDVKKYQYLRGTHDCIIGTAADTREMQMMLLEERRKNIDIQIRKHQTRLHIVERKLAEKAGDDSLLNESKTIVEKTETLFEKRDLLQHYIKGLLAPARSHSDSCNQIGNKTAHHISTIFGQDSTSLWEEAMGHFQTRYIIHNPQIIWNNSVRNIVYHFMDLQEHKRAISYYMSARAVKFLRDISEKHQLKRKQRQSHVFTDDDEEGLDNEAAQQLLDQLLAEKDKKFYVQNETENTAVNDDQHGNQLFNEDVNNPAKHIQNLPTGYSMQSSYLLDLLNPQISLQSDRDPDNLVLMSNERMQVKAFGITEDKETELEMQLVKNRTIISFDNTQFFVAKKEKFDTVDLLFDNHYGAKGHEHWLTWIPSEMLISYVKKSDKFQRVGTQLSPTIQIDRYNKLRLKAHGTLFNRYYPLEERCDNIHVNFPNLALTADSSQYNAIYEVVVDLLLYKEPAKKERLERLHEIMLAADQGGLSDTTENIVELQQRSRQYMNIRDNYTQNLAILDPSQLEEFKKISIALQDSYQDLYLGMEAIKALQSNRRNIHHNEASSNLKFVFSAEKISWEMRIDSETPLCEWHLNNTTFTLVNKDDHSHINTVEVDLLQVKNTSQNPAYTEVLSPFIDNRTKLPDFSRHKMLRCYLVALAPVGGIPVIQHLEINLFPLRLQMTYDFGKTMASYFFPAEKRQKDNQQITAQNSSNSTNNNNSNNSNINVTNTNSTISNQTNNTSPTTFSNTSTYNGSIGGGSDNISITSESLNKLSPINLEFKDKDKDSICSRNKSNYQRSATIDTVPPMSVSDSSSWASPTVIVGSPPRSEQMDSANDNQSGSSIALNGPPSNQSIKSLKRNKQKAPDQTDDLLVMKKRASGNRTFILVKIPGTKHCLTYKGPKEKNIEDLREFAFQQPYLEYRNKTWSWFELINNIKRDFMRAALLNNSRALLKEKLTIRLHPRAEGLASSSLSDSNLFTMINIPASTEITPRHVTYDWEDESVSDEYDNNNSNRDDISLHSAISYDHDINEKHIFNGHSYSSWSSKFRRKKSAGKAHETIQSLHCSTDIHHNNTADNSVMEELTNKGRLLLGKHYNGPSLTTISSAGLQNQHKKKQYSEWV